MPTPVPSRQARSYGTMRRPVRASGNMLLVPQPVGPVPWTYDADNASTAVWWVGDSIERGDNPIGPHGPWATDGSGQPVVTRATSLLVDPLTTGEYRVRDVRDGPPGDVLTTPSWLADPQLLRPDLRFGPSLVPAARRVPRSVFWRRWFVSALWWGSGFLWFHEDAAGQPLAGSLQIVHPGLVDVTDDMRWRIGADDGRGVEFDEDGRLRLGDVWTRLVWLPNPLCEDGVFLTHPQTFALANTIGRYTSGVFASGVPAGFLKVTAPQLSQAQADQLKSAWMAAHGGDRRSIAVLNATTDFTPIALSPVDTALLDVSRFQLAQVAFAFGMAPEMLGMGMGDSLTYSNIAQWFEVHRDFALSPWIAAGEGVLSALLPRGQVVEVNLDAYTQPTESQRIADGAKAVQFGLFTADEWRAREGLEPLGADEPVRIGEVTADEPAGEAVDGAA